MSRRTQDGTVHYRSMGDHLRKLLGLEPTGDQYWHEWKWANDIYNGVTVGAKRFTCRCGAESFELTGAGYQQLGWWMAQDGLSHEEARAKIEAGDYPWHLFGMLASEATMERALPVSNGGAGAFIPWVETEGPVGETGPAQPMTKRELTISFYVAPQYTWDPITEEDDPEPSGWCVCRKTETADLSVTRVKKGPIHRTPESAEQHLAWIVAQVNSSDPDWWEMTGPAPAAGPKPCLCGDPTCRSPI